MKIINGYILDNQRALLSIEEVRENPKKAGHFPHADNIKIFCEELPKFKEYEIPVLLEDNKTWEVRPDYRGISFYSKETGEHQELIKEVGTEPDFKLYTLKPRTEYYQKFDNKKDDWVEDKEKREADEKAAQIVVLKSQIEDLEQKQIRYIKEVFNNKATADGKKKYDEWETELLPLRKKLQEL